MYLLERGPEPAVELEDSLKSHISSGEEGAPAKRTIDSLLKNN